MGCPADQTLFPSRLPPGPRNAITDVAGVAVGHCTLARRGDLQTGVTAVLPHGGNLFREKVPAGCAVFNGFGKTMGLMQLAELGTLETPIVLTNTLSAGTAYTALVRRALEENPSIGISTGTVNPLVCECNDGQLNDIRSLPITEDHVFQALAAAAPVFAEGAVGAGRGMVCYGCKGGIGTASRLAELPGTAFTVGALVLTNYGRAGDLRRMGRPLAPQGEVTPDRGSVITLLATDAPLLPAARSPPSRRASCACAGPGPSSAAAAGSWRSASPPPVGSPTPGTPSFWTCGSSTRTIWTPSSPPPPRRWRTRCTAPFSTPRRSRGSGGPRWRL